MEKIEEYLANQGSNDLSISKGVYESLKETVVFSDVIDFLMSSAGSLLFTPLAIHYQSQYPFIKQYIEFIKNTKSL